MYANEDEEKSVRESVLHKEKHKKGRNKIKADTESIKNREYVVLWFGSQPEPAGFYSEDKEDRNDFVRKVFIILFIMLLVTFGFNLLVMMHEDLRDFFREYFLYIMIPCIIVLAVMGCCMSTLECCRRSPTNYICLIIVVILYSLFCACYTARYRTHIIVIALVATLGVVAVCVALACTNFDFTKCILYVIVVSVALSLLVLIVVIMMLVFNVYSKPLMLALIFVLTLVNVVMFIIELQMVLGGKSVELGEEDYALGAYMLYTSIVQLFINILLMAGLADS
ncbi:protein lifeguard 2-like [Cydia strobilella]|uniref:protein lifeguard 2-like n=1 Tax=Cydia strobilella TaxID=1100964 RepID=UPI00300573AB